jgi:hypothetical protein
VNNHMRPVATIAAVMPGEATIPAPATTEAKAA